MALVSTEGHSDNDDFRVTDRYLKENELSGNFFVIGGDVNLWFHKKEVEEEESKKMLNVSYDMMLKGNELNRLIIKEEEKYKVATSYKEKESILKNIKSYLIQLNNIRWKEYKFNIIHKLSTLTPKYPENYNFETVYGKLDLRMNAEQLEKADKEKAAKEKSEQEAKEKAEKEAKEKAEREQAEKEKKEKDKDKDNKEVPKSENNQ